MSSQATMSSNATRRCRPGLRGLPAAKHFWQSKQHETVSAEFSSRAGKLFWAGSTERKAGFSGIARQGSRYPIGLQSCCLLNELIRFWDDLSTSEIPVMAPDTSLEQPLTASFSPHKMPAFQPSCTTCKGIFSHMTATSPGIPRSSRIDLGAPGKLKIETHSNFSSIFSGNFNCIKSATPVGAITSLPRQGRVTTDPKAGVRVGATPGFGSVARPKPCSVPAVTPGVAPTRTALAVTYISAYTRASSGASHVKSACHSTRQSQAVEQTQRCLLQSDLALHVYLDRKRTTGGTLTANAGIGRVANEGHSHHTL